MRTKKIFFILAAIMTSLSTYSQMIFKINESCFLSKKTNKWSETYQIKTPTFVSADDYVDGFIIVNGIVEDKLLICKRIEPYFREDRDKDVNMTTEYYCINKQKEKCNIKIILYNYMAVIILKYENMAYMLIANKNQQ